MKTDSMIAQGAHDDSHGASRVREVRGDGSGKDAARFIVSGPSECSSRLRSTTSLPRPFSGSDASHSHGFAAGKQPPERWARNALLLILLFLQAACGYRVAGSVQNLPGGVRSIGIPTFKNDTRQFKIEQRMTSAVLKEFTLRTRVPVSSNPSGVEAVLQGEVKDMSSNPEAFGSNAFASAFLVTVHMSIRLVRVKDGAVIWENPDFSFHGRYVLTTRVTEFFSEENAALDRMAREFAASLASSILTR